MEVCIYCLSLLPLFVGILCWVFVCGVVLNAFYSFVLILLRNERAGSSTATMFYYSWPVCVRVHSLTVQLVTLSLPQWDNCKIKEDQIYNTEPGLNTKSPHITRATKNKLNEPPP